MATKLIRLHMDRVGPIPDGLTKAPIDDQDLIKALLIAKLHEETSEIAAADDIDVRGELADALEVIISIGAMHRLSISDLLHTASWKRDERGGFIELLGPDRFSAMLQRDA